MSTYDGTPQGEFEGTTSESGDNTPDSERFNLSEQQKVLMEDIETVTSALLTSLTRTENLVSQLHEAVTASASETEGGVEKSLEELRTAFGLEAKRNGELMVGITKRQIQSVINATLRTKFGMSDKK